MCQVLTRFSVNLATCFILCDTCPKTLLSTLKDQMFLLSIYHSTLVFRRSCFQISPKRLVVLIDILWALSWKLSYYCFLPYEKV